MDIGNLLDRIVTEYIKFRFNHGGKVLTDAEARREHLGGAMIYFYDAGTANPATTWSDDAMTVANTNPLILMDSGEARPVKFLPDHAYRVFVRNWTGRPICDVDEATSPAP